MLIFYFFLSIIIIIIILLFSSPKLSPIPCFPSQQVDIPLIIKALNLKKNQTLVDLGAGDGIVIFKAASESLRKKLNTKFVAVEINPILILILNIRRFFHPNRKNIKIVHDDIFRMNFKPFMYESVATDHYKITFYLYISPWFLEKTVSNVKKQLPKFSVVSYMYPIRSLKNKERIIQGKNNIFTYC